MVSPAIVIIGFFFPNVFLPLLAPIATVFLYLYSLYTGVVFLLQS